MNKSEFLNNMALLKAFMTETGDVELPNGKTIPTLQKLVKSLTALSQKTSSKCQKKIINVAADTVNVVLDDACFYYLLVRNDAPKILNIELKLDRYSEDQIDIIRKVEILFINDDQGRSIAVNGEVYAIGANKMWFKTFYCLNGHIFEVKNAVQTS